MNELEYVPVPAFEDNYIWLVSDGSNAVAVDPGDAAPVRRYLEVRDWRLAAILLTHHHADHVGGVVALLEHAAGAGPVPVYGPAGEGIVEVSEPLPGGVRVRIGKPALEFEVFDVPGHTLGHIAYYQAAGADYPAPHLFCGDTLFSCGCGRLFEGTPAQMLASLDVLAALPGETQVHCAHEYTLSNIRFALACEPDNAALAAWRDDASARRARGEPTLPTTIAHERAVNPFLRADSASIAATLAVTLKAELYEALADRLAVFTLMRDWKTRFY